MYCIPGRDPSHWIPRAESGEGQGCAHKTLLWGYLWLGNCCVGFVPYVSFPFLFNRNAEDDGTKDEIDADGIP
jgi:hypothetical protein